MLVKFEHIEERDIPCPFYIGTFGDTGLKSVTECHNNKTIKYYNHGDYATIAINCEQFNGLLLAKCERLLSHEEAYEFIIDVLNKLPLFNTLKM